MVRFNFKFEANMIIVAKNGWILSDKPTVVCKIWLDFHQTLASTDHQLKQFNWISHHKRIIATVVSMISLTLKLKDITET